MPLLPFVRHCRTLLTGPLHHVNLRKQCRLGRAPLMVPFYHRVADTQLNPWTMTRRMFARQIETMTDRLQPRPLDQVQDLIGQGRCDRPTVTVTFDDGYAENSEFALPLLIERRIPVVYFVTVNNIVTGKPFEHDVRNGTPLAVNTVADLRELADLGIEIGLHARDHVDFSKLTCAAEVDQQIVVAKDELEQLLGRSVRYFAFPFGMPAQLTPVAIAAVRRAGLDGFCSAFGAYNVPERDVFHIRRFHGDPEFSRFKNWISFDRRKLRCEPEISLPAATNDHEQLAQAAPGSATAPVDVGLPPIAPSLAAVDASARLPESQ